MEGSTAGECEHNRVKPLLTFGQHLLSQLDSLLEGAVLNVADSVLMHKHLQQTNLNIVPSAAELSNLDDAALKLWNHRICSQERAAWKKLVCLVQAFAANLLIICQNGNKDNTEYLIRVFKSCLRAARSCLENEHTALAKSLLERCADYDASLQKQSSSNTTATDSFDCHTQYLVQRLHLAVKSDKLDGANMYFAILEKELRNLNQTSWKAFVRLVVQTGQRLSTHGKSKDACIWLSRAYQLMTGEHNNQNREPEPVLQLQVLQALLNLQWSDLGRPEKSLIEKLLKTLENSQANSMQYRLTVLEYCTKEQNLDSPDIQCRFNDSLRHFAQKASLSQTTFETIIYYANKQHTISSTQAFSVLKGILIPRLIDEQNLDWVERTIIMMVYFQGKMETSVLNDLNFDLEVILTDCQRNFGDCVSVLGAHACLMGVSMGLQRAEKNKDQPDQPAVFKWCKIGLHKIFHNIDEVNKAKLQRKLMQYWIREGKPLKVKEVYESMSQPTQESTESLFLLYRSAIVAGFVELGKQALNGILSTGKQDLEIISACIDEARLHKDNPSKTSHWVLEVILFGQNNSSLSYPPAMYRYALKLGEEPKHGNALMTRRQRIQWTCDLLEKAMQTMIQESSNTLAIWTIPELEWFYTTAWNLTIHQMKEWALPKVLTLAKVSSAFLHQIVKKSTADAALSKRYLSAIFLECALTLTRARETSDDEERDRLYQAVISKGREFMQKSREAGNTFAHEDFSELKEKGLAILTFQFEAAMKTKDWDGAMLLLQYAEQDDGQYLEYNNQAILGDLVLSIDAPSEVKSLLTTTQSKLIFCSVRFKLLEIIINNCYSLTNDLPKLSRWIRCLFSLTAETEPARAASCLEQACTIAEQNPDQYPDEELRWLAIHTYNNATDFFGLGQDDLWTTWANLALRLAQAVSDGGLHTHLSQCIAETQRE